MFAKLPFNCATVVGTSDSPWGRHVCTILFMLCVLSCCKLSSARFSRIYARRSTGGVSGEDLFIRNHAGGAALENAADEELSKWGRFTLADDEASADIILVFSKNGVQNTEKSENKKDGTCCDTSYGASFSPGATARAYLKGHGPGPGSLPFWQDGCGGMTQKATGKGCIDAFKKQFPR